MKIGGSSLLSRFMLNSIVYNHINANSLEVLRKVGASGGRLGSAPGRSDLPVAGFGGLGGLPEGRTFRCRVQECSRKVGPSGGRLGGAPRKSDTCLHGIEFSIIRGGGEEPPIFKKSCYLALPRPCGRRSAPCGVPPGHLCTRLRNSSPRAWKLEERTWKVSRNFWKLSRTT